MSVEETQQVVGEYLDVLLGGGDFGAYFADDVRWTTMETGDVISGRDAVRDFIIALHTELFDAAPELGQLVCGDHSAALEATFIGKHIAAFAGVEATGAEVRLPYAVFYELEGGQITVLRAYFPITSMIEQLRTQSAPVTT